MGGRLVALHSDTRDRFRLLGAAWLDQAFFTLADALEVELLIECGAHEASASIEFVSTHGRRAIAIEANPRTCNAITSAAARSGVTVVNAGLGDREGQAAFFIPREHGADIASFLKKPSRDYEDIQVNVTTLDRIVTDHPAGPGSIALWIDVEGFGHEVLRGGLTLLRDARCKLIKIEVETRPHWDGQKLVDEVDSLLADCGFTPVLRDCEYEGQHNLIYVRSDAASGLDDHLLMIWARLCDLKPPPRRWTLKSAAQAVKTRIMPGGRGPMLVHRFAAQLGSVSSAQAVQSRRRRSG